MSNLSTSNPYTSLPTAPHSYSSDSSVSDVSALICIMQTDTDKLNDSYAALERKAALYDRLSVGRFDDDEEQYNVDFLQKGSLSDEMPGDRHRPAYDAAEPIDTASMAIRASGKPCLTYVEM